jgi:hypothetical protein
MASPLELNFTVIFLFLPSRMGLSSLLELLLLCSGPAFECCAPLRSKSSALCY